MLIALASGKKCVFHSHKDRKYRHYDPNTIAQSKDQDNLELEFRNQVQCFQACFIDDVENCGFRYPDNLNKQDIIEDIKKWMKFAEVGGRDILLETYQKLITLLKEERKIFVDQIKTTKVNSSDIINNEFFKGVNKKETSNFISASLLSNKNAFELETKIKKDYENGDYSIKANLYHDPPKQKNIFEKIGEKIKYASEESHNFLSNNYDNK